jgi:hypothetical protein
MHRLPLKVGPVMLNARAEALSAAKGKHLGAYRNRPFAEFNLSGAKKNHHNSQ